MENILVKDMMVPLADYVTVSDRATLADAVAALKKAQQEFDRDRYRHRAVLVLDQHGKVVGKVSQINALQALEPKYRGLGDLQELEGLYGLKADNIRRMISDHGLWKMPIDDICQKSAAISVRDIMHKPTEGEIVDQDASLNEAIHQLIIGKHQSLLVVRDREIVGVLRLSDVFQRVGDIMAACAI
ncbi:CBS domain-containing protein [Desulfatitalea alkaliphila]|uniref:CBS domain-containing protein n=1 Tax=Desulfatitalea alkaliphila TaxID=2929485 RepID=A0AA41UP55_9BACT|nr:CBS domain-containing protein [Desulfatitalea alkaliphila]MCJ8500158.1 CBS domain-containing protein [Desulfatitalea alkaliphila]